MTTNQSLIDSLHRQPHDQPLIFLDDNLKPTYLPLGELRSRADAVAAVLHHRYGIGPGRRVCVLGRTSLELITTLFGIWRSGAAVTVLPLPRTQDPAELRDALQRRILAAHGSLVVTDSPTAAQATHLPVPVTDFRTLAAGHPAPPPPAPDPDGIALLQFTSGTTAAPRAVAVTQRQLLTNSRQVLDRGDLGPGDTFASWLPLYHDMGIVLLTGAISLGYTACTMATQTFSARPGAWLEAITTYRAAATAAPNFAYGLANRYLQLGRGGYDLSSLRFAINGAEPIDASALDSFVATGTRHGLAPTTMSPSYGLAEATLGVTVGSHDETYHSITLDRAALEAGEVREVPPGDAGRTFVDCGRPLEGTDVTITDDAGAVLGEGRIGSVRVEGPGVVPEYWTHDGSAHPSSLLDHHGRLVTGDLGFQLGGRLFVCGRQKDMIIVGGRNLFPEDFEFTTEHIPGIRLGNVMAFSLPHTEKMVVVAETQLQGDAAHQLAHSVETALTDELSYTPHDIVLVTPGTLPKTTSGKRQRGVCREHYQSGALQVRAATRAEGALQ